MPNPVRLDFVTPIQPDLVALYVEEATDPAGPFVQLAEITDIGAYPNYISYVTVDANDPNDWFRIYWKNADGADTPYSEAIQGGTSTLVQEIVNRVMLRAPYMKEMVATQTAEWVICKVLNVDDPYDPTLTATYSQLEGMTLLALAGVMTTTLASSASGDSYSAGLVSQKSSTSQTVNQKMIEYLLQQANKLLGISLTFVMLLEEIDPTGIGAVSGLEDDISRGIMTEYLS